MRGFPAQAAERKKKETACVRRVRQVVLPAQAAEPECPPPQSTDADDVELTPWPKRPSVQREKLANVAMINSGAKRNRISRPS